MKLDRRQVAADHLAELHVVAHRRGDDDLAALVVVGDHGGHVRHVAAVVLEVDAAAADHARREAHAHRRDQVRRLVDEQVGEHAAAEGPVAAPLRLHGPVERLLLRRRAERLAVARS